MLLCAASLAPLAALLAPSPRWETATMPTYDYNGPTRIVIGPGMENVKQHNGAVVRLLEEIVAHDFFSYFPVNLITPCMYFPTSEDGCELDRCEIESVRDRDVPPDLLARDLSEYGFTIDGWCRKDMPSIFTDYFDLRACASRNTGYNGSRTREGRSSR